MGRWSLILGALFVAACAGPGRVAGDADSPPSAEALGGRHAFTLDLGGHSASVTRALFAPDGRQLVTAGADHRVRVWDTETWQTRKVIYPPGEGVPWAAALSPDGRRLAVSSFHKEKDKSVFVICLFALPEGRLERTLRGHTSHVLGLTFSPDGKRLASAGGADRTTRVWDLAGEAEPQVIPCPLGGKLIGQAFSPDGRLLARAAEDKDHARLFQIIETATGKEVVDKREGGPVAWGPDGKTLAAGGKGLHLYEPDGTLRARVRETTDVAAVAFGADPQTVLGVWADKGAHHAGLFAAADGKLLRTFGPAGSGAHACALSPDGQLAVTTGWGGGHDVLVWRTTDGKQVRNLAPPRWLREGGAVVWKQDVKPPQGHDALSWGWSGKEPSFLLGEVHLGPPIGWAAHTHPVLAMALEKTGEDTWQLRRRPRKGERLPLTLAGATKAKMLTSERAVLYGPTGFALFDVPAGKIIQRFHGHREGVEDVSLSADGHFLASASLDQTVRVWSPDSPRPLLSLHVRGGDWVAWTEEGYYAASPGGEHWVGFLADHGIDQAPTFYPAGRLRASLYRPDVLGRVLHEGSVKKALEAADKVRGVKKSEPVAVEEVLPPEVTLAAAGSKDGKVTVMAPSLEVEATARGAGKHPVTALQLLLDGRPYEGARALRRIEGPKAGAAITEKWTVEVPEGEHTLRVLARTEVSTGLSNDLEVDFASPVPKPRLYVLAVGINEYRDKNLELKCAVNDAVELEKTFRARSTALFDVQTQVLTDAKATRQAILEEGFGWLKKNMKGHDVAVVFYAGHGEQDGKSFYLLPQDVNVKNLKDTGISGEKLKERLADLPGKVLLLLDACHSGAVGKAINDIARDLADEDCGVVVMCAALGSEKAGEAAGHGFFCKAMLEVLSGENHAPRNPRDRCVYLHHLEQYVIDRVQELSKDEQHPTTAKPAIRPYAVARP
jgi:WD40 repeat protein